MLTMTGCSETPTVRTAEVQFDDGSPVRAGSVELRRLEDGERYAGRLNDSGTASLSDAGGDPGVPPGKYEAVVVQIVLTEDLAAAAHTHGGTVPRRYADYYTSGLRVEVTDGQIDPIKLQLATQ